MTGFNYQPISNIEVIFTVGKLRKGETAENLRLIVPYEGYTGKTNNEYAPSSKRMMDKIVSEAKKMGANGLIDFKTTYNARNRAWVASWNSCYYKIGFQFLPFARGAGIFLKC